MNICLATYQSVMLLRGGPRTQILQTRNALDRLGVRASLFESWEEFQKDIDIFHLFGANIGTIHLAREIHRLGVPLVITPIFFTRHGRTLVRAVVGLDGFFRGLARGGWTDYGIAAQICSWAAAVMPNTAAEARLIEKGLGIPAGKIAVVPNGFEERFAHGDPALFREKFGVRDFILSVGHIGPERKNVLRLIQALEGVDRPGVIIGRIEDNDYARRCVEEAKKNPRLMLLDGLANDSELLASAYAACDVFALPSQFETPGIAALEAAAAGAKIVITNSGGTEEYFGAMAEYVEPSSVESIRRGIGRALQKQKSHDLSRHVGDHFTWKKVAEQTAAVYERVLSDSGRRNHHG